MIQIGFIGDGKHASKLKDIINKCSHKTKITLFNYNNKINLNSNLDTTSDIKNLLKLDTIFILCPNVYHFYYLELLYKNNYKGYIFCEKPICENKEQFKKINNILLSNYKKLFINFHQRHNDLLIEINKIIKKRSFGKIIYFNIFISQGLAYKKEFKKSWRNNSNKNFIIINKSIHWIDLLIKFFNKPKKIDYELLNYSKSSKIPDTCSVNMKFNKNINATIFNSYATPYNYEIQVMGTNAYLNYKNNKLNFFHPRNTFDKKGYFKKPKNSQIFLNKNHKENQLDNSINYFLDKVSKKKYFKKIEIKQILETHDIIFNHFS